MTSIVKLFFFDYGTTGHIHINHCKILIEDFATVPRKAIRGGLYGIKPTGNQKLWGIDITTEFVEHIQNKIYKIKIIKYHQHVCQECFIYLSTDVTYKLFNSRKTFTSFCFTMERRLLTGILSSADTPRKWRTANLTHRAYLTRHSTSWRGSKFIPLSANAIGCKKYTTSTSTSSKRITFRLPRIPLPSRRN